MKTIPQGSQTYSKSAENLLVGKILNEDIIKEAAMAKLFSSEMCMRVTTEAIQVLGGYGYIKEYDVERFFRDSKILEIGEGTSEVQRIIISREILKNISSV